MDGINLDGVKKMCRDARILSWIKSRLTLSVRFFEDGSSELVLEDLRFNEVCTMALCDNEYEEIQEWLEED